MRYSSLGQQTGLHGGAVIDYYTTIGIVASHAFAPFPEAYRRFRSRFFVYCAQHNSLHGVCLSAKGKGLRDPKTILLQ